MPPSKHSGSSMSAHKDSDQIPSDQNYTLGDYSFRIERSSVPGSSNDKIEAICTDKDGKNARKSIQVPSSTQIKGWYVEANETEATVYVVIEGGAIDAVLAVADGDWVGRSEEQADGWKCSAVYGIALYPRGSSVYLTQYGGSIYGAGATASSIRFLQYPDTQSSAGWARGLSGGNLFYWVMQGPYGPYNDIPVSSIDPTGRSISEIDISGEKLVGRFAIDLEDAGGVGPGSGWIDPGDYDPDWEPDDPTHTLYVTVTGALSGRHNDPIVDPSYSYIPADKDTVKDYGCGGDGGHGGGGGAGASTVVIHKFATNQANSKEVTAIARRHGYGSGGGKGGKGGDGCILVYY